LFVSDEPLAGTMNLYGEVFAEFYDRHFSQHAEKTAPFLLKFFASFSPAITRLPVLDLGCGTGRLALRFLEAGHSCVGLDQSPFMLFLAENRCWRYVAGRQGRFLQEDISRFQIGGSFGMALSTYNVLNHLESEEKLRGCFRSVRRCLAKGGRLTFDFHTLEGLQEWASAESAQWEGERVECEGEFDRGRRKASMRLRGEVGGRTFEERIMNYAYPLERVARWLGEEGFKKADFYRIDELEKPLPDPEREKRVVVVAG
jgi:SAM-dependent methyltransferase